MNRISFHGDIKSDSSNLVLTTFKEWLHTDSIDAKDRMFGFELTYDDDITYVYCHEATMPPGSDRLFLVEGSINSIESDPVRKLKGLVRLCTSKGIECALDYTPVDSEGEPVGEEVTLTASDSLA